MCMYSYRAIAKNHSLYYVEKVCYNPLLAM